MFTSSGTGALPPIGISKINYINNKDKDINTHAVHSGNYDSISFSSATGENHFYNEIVSRISQEVRTTTSTGDIRVISEELSSGNYVLDPMSIAARIMFLEGDA